MLFSFFMFSNMKLPQTAILSYKLSMQVLGVWFCYVMCWSAAARSGICRLLQTDDEQISNMAV